jgi:hypothetical protein
MENIEILVHIAAPSCAKDDQKYRRQATAFLKFEKERKTALIESRSGSGRPESLVTAFDYETEEGKDVRAQKHPDDLAGTGHYTEAMFAHEEQSKGTTPRIRSGRTVSGRHDGMFMADSSSPCPRATKTRPSKIIEIENVISSSTISPGQPEPEPATYPPSRKRKNHGVEGTPVTFLRTPGGTSTRTLSSHSQNYQTSSPKVSRVSETPLPPRSVALGASPPSNIISSKNSPLESRRPRAAPSGEIKSHLHSSSRVGLRRSRSTTASVESPLSVIPDSQLPFSTAPERVSRMEDPSNRRPHEIGSQEPPNKRIRIETPSEQSNSVRQGNSSGHPISISSDELPLRSSQRSDKDEGPQAPSTPSSFLPPSPTLRPLPSPLGVLESEPRLPRSFGDPLDAFNSLPYSSVAPAPPPAYEANLNDISEGLRAIERGLPLAEHFRPVSQSRELTALERGHWEVTIPISRTAIATTNQQGSAWHPQEFVKFYLFVDELIQKKRAGWDVWATRDLVFYNIDGELWDADGMRRETFRLFCRGGIVGHVWLALFLGGNRRIKGMRAVWKDAEEKVVVRMA